MSEKKKLDIELLAPAGSYEALQAAIDNGADAVYFGIGQINMRKVAAANFDFDDLKKIGQICRENKVKTYLTVNTILYDHDLVLMRKVIDAAKAEKIDAVILADMAAILYAESIGMPMHISTQVSISNTEAVKFFAQYADTVVLARELTLPMIEKITKQIKKEKITGPSGELVKIEMFAHGALCIAVSGRCSMSLFQYNASANRGACQQTCRRKFKVTDEETNQELVVDNNYIMSPKDICTIGFLDDFIDAGVQVLKLEGRGRSPEYVAKVVKAYREALIAIENNEYNLDKKVALEAELKTVFNRGFSDGYYLGRSEQEWAASAGNQSSEEKFFAGVVTNYFSKNKIVEIQLQAQDTKLGDNFSITGVTTGVVFDKIKSLRNEKEEEIKKADKKELITIALDKKVRKGDKFYLIKKREGSN